MKLWSFVITACRHFSSEAAASSNKKKYKGNSFWSKKKKDLGSSSSSSLKKVTRPKIKWTDEQNRVMAAVCDGKSIFITGSAGTGKTLLLKEVIKKLKKIHGRSSVYVTASTGVAACALHGLTLHSFAGVGYGELGPQGLLERVFQDAGACRRWKKAKALVIDETSMVDANLFDGLAYIARMLREDEESESGNKTWGGIQLIVSGDFFQLPPIMPEKNKCEKIYAFEADCWSSSFDLQIELTKVFRQSDSLLVHLLQGIRKADSDPDDLTLLMECCSVSEPDPSAVRLFPRITDVNKVNTEKLGELDQEIYAYSAQDSGEVKRMRQLKSGIAPDRLEICVGARVMLIKNLNLFKKLVNGATGTVLELCRVDGEKHELFDMCSHGNLLPLVKFDSGHEMLVEPETWEVRDGEKVVARRRQIPLILSWALSIHKCQGMSLDKLHTDLSRVFGYGMVYVALSRVRSLNGLCLSGLDPSKIMAHPKVLEFYRVLAKSKMREKGSLHIIEVASVNDAGDLEAES